MASALRLLFSLSAILLAAPGGIHVLGHRSPLLPDHAQSEGVRWDEEAQRSHSPVYVTGGAGADAVAQDAANRKSQDVGAFLETNAQTGYEWATPDQVKGIWKMKRGVERTRMRVGSRLVDIEEYLSSGKHGAAFRVTLDEKTAAVMKVSEEDLSHEAAMMRQAAGVPHAITLYALDTLRGEPGFRLFEMMVGGPKALLQSLARGKAVLTKKELEEGELDIFKRQLVEFGHEMTAKHLMHADLRGNVLWDQEKQEVTVIDFGNAFDVRSKSLTNIERANLGMKKDADGEVEKYLNM